LADLNIPPTQLVAFPYIFSGLLAILAGPLYQVRDHLFYLLIMLTSLRHLSPKVGCLYNEAVPSLLLPMKE
jgi:hypothetical protein